MQNRIHILLLVSTVIPETLLDSILTPLYPFVIRHMIPELPEEQLGYYLGLIRIFYNAPMLVTNLLWGRLSDMLVAGIFGSNSTIVKAMIGDFAPDLETRSWGYAIYGSVFGITGIIGPVIARVLAPNSQERCSKGILCEYPYLMILSSGAAIVFIAFVLGTFLPFKPFVYSPIEEVETGNNQETTFTPNANNREDGQLVDELEDYSQAQLPSSPLADSNTVCILILYCIIAFVNTNYKVGIPLYFSAKEYDGGLGYDASYVSGTFAFLAGAKLACQLLLFPQLVKYFVRPILVYRMGMMLYIPLHLLFPSIIYLANARGMAIIGLMLSMGFCESISYLSIILLITESQSKHLGFVHGISTTMTALPAYSGKLGYQIMCPGLYLCLVAYCPP
ncbi:hypothetical protein HDV01_007779 [Terramyces sp. JEL0728]|nr:hypothetical protein HDV01_007779 [Terramyces sp. JEL0728]